MRNPLLLLVALRSGESALFLNGKKVLAAMPGSDLATEAAAGISSALGIPAKVFGTERPEGTVIDWDAVHRGLPDEAKRAPADDVVPAAHWNSEKYGGDQKTGATYNFRMSDQRQRNGQVYLDVEPVEGHTDDNGIGVTIEVGNTPGVDDSHVPAVHINFGNGDLAASIFQNGLDSLIIRPEVGVWLVSTVLADTTSAWCLRGDGNA